MIKGDTGTKTIKTTSITVDNSDNMTIPFASILNVNRIKSVRANDDLILDANGTGLVKIETAVNGGFYVETINGANLNWIGGRFNTTGASSTVILGNYYNVPNSQWYNTVGAHNSALTAWDTLHLNWGGNCIFGDRPRSFATGYTVAIDGNLKVNGRIDASITNSAGGRINANATVTSQYSQLEGGKTIIWFKAGTGGYVGQFSSALSAIPNVIQVTAMTNGALFTAVVENPLTTQIAVNTYNSSGANADCDFSFYIVQ